MSAELGFFGHTYIVPSLAYQCRLGAGGCTLCLPSVLTGVKTGKLIKMLDAFRADNTLPKPRSGSWKSSPTKYPDRRNSVRG